MAKTVTPIDELKRLVQTTGNQRSAAAQLGVTQAFVSDLLLGRRGFSPKVLARMGIVKRETFTRVAK